MPSIPRGFLNFEEFINFCQSHGRILSDGVLFTALSRVWTLASTRRLWFSTHRSWCVNWFSKQSAITLAFSNRRNLKLEGPSSISSWCLWSIPLYDGFRNGPYSLRCDIRVTLFVSHRSSAFLPSIRLIVFATQLTADLHAGPQVSCHNFLIPCFCCNKRSKPGRSLFRFESVTFLVDNLYGEAIEAVKSRAALLASTPQANFESRWY
jgi:hypothetical protein